MVTTDLEIQQYCPHAIIIDRDPNSSNTSIGTTEGRTRLQPSVADPASSPKCDVCNDNSSNDDEASSTSDDYKIDDIIYDQISTLKTIKFVVLYDCFWDGQNKLLDRDDCCYSLYRTGQKQHHRDNHSFQCTWSMYHHWTW